MSEPLPNIPFFQNLEEAQIALLKPLLENFTCPADTMIFEQGEPASYLYLLVRGSIAIRYKPYDTPAITLTRLRSGDVFGWSAVIGSTYYTSSTISETDVNAVRIRGIFLQALCREYPEDGRIIMNHLANVVSARWKNARSQVQSLLNSDPPV
ncbi:MAG: cyclic nucleotide-binding domain-containing protein [Chloroflexi bacterium]|nr:cyclic nucleotide-binding domain-containing protein [Chloroflexota bacterium]